MTSAAFLVLNQINISNAARRLSNLFVLVIITSIFAFRLPIIMENEESDEEVDYQALAGQLKEQGNQAFEKGDTDTAIKLYTQVYQFTYREMLQH